MDMDKENRQKELTPDEQVEHLFADLMENFCEHPNEQSDIALADILKNIPKTGWSRDDTEEEHQRDANLKAHYTLKIDNKEGPDNILTINVWWRGDVEYENYLLQLSNDPNVPGASPETLDMDNLPTGATLLVQTEDGNIYNFSPKAKTVQIEEKLD